MGCDIHLYVEYIDFIGADGKPYWSNFGERFNPGRNYELFSRIAGVRGSREDAIVPPRGIPEQVAFMTSCNWWLFISEGGEGSCSMKDAERYAEIVERDALELGVRDPAWRLDREGKRAWVRCPDWHTPTWLTVVEFECVLLGVEHDVAYDAVLAAAQRLEKAGKETRLVIWFDN